jgi:NADPH:quinone reductase-like Zn-dependent oxidoreductase
MSNLAMTPKVQDLTFVKELIEKGEVRSVIDRIYPMDRLAEAINYYAQGHSQGKVVIRVDQKGEST